MALQIPDASPGGFRSYSFQLVAEEDGTQLLFSNDVVRLYLSHVAACKAAGDEPPAFGEWLDGDDDHSKLFDTPGVTVMVHPLGGPASDQLVS